MLDRVANPRPRRQRFGRSESTLTDRLLRIGNTAPHRNATFDGAAQIAETRVRNGGNFGNRRHA